MGGCDLSLDRHVSEVVCHKAFLYSTTQHTPVQLDIMKLGRELLLAVVVFCVLPSFPSPFLSSPHGLYDLYYILHAAFFTTSKHLFHLLPDGCISLASQFTHAHLSYQVEQKPKATIFYDNLLCACPKPIYVGLRIAPMIHIQVVLAFVTAKL